MSIGDTVYTALKSLIDQGLVHEVRSARHPQYVEGGSLTEEVNVSAILNSREPEQHRPEIESLLREAGLGQFVLHLQGNPMTPAPSSATLNNQEPADAPAEDEQQIRDRAYRLWESEGRPEGRADEYWHRARELIEAETQSSYPPTQSRGHRT